MRNVLPIALAFFLLASAACKRPVQQQTPAASEIAEMDAGMNSSEKEGATLTENKEMMEQQGHDESLGVKTLRGKLGTTKGHQPTLQGVILSKSIFSSDRSLADKRIHELEGKLVEVTGEVIRHHCGPLEQCLSQGYIDWLKNASDFKEVEE